MRHLLHSLKRHGFGRRAMTESDLYLLCDLYDIDIVWSDRNFAFFFTDPDWNVRGIVLPKKLSGLRLLFAAYHELGHSMTAGGDEIHVALLGDSDHKCEAEADAIALIALMPSPDTEIDHYGDPEFARYLVEARRRFADEYGF